MNTNQRLNPLRNPSAAACLALVALAGSNLAQACSAPKDTGPANTTAAARLVPVSYRFDSPDIVGLWRFEMLSRSTHSNTNPMPDGTLIDFGTTAWHGDGTETMNSGIRNPADNDICQGAWQQVGPNTFELNHLALAWTNGSYTGPTTIRERVTVDRSGKHFSGTFTITAYLATVTAGHEFDQTTPVARITGTLTASRITAD
jgi:hypothetical protein